MFKKSLYCKLRCCIFITLCLCTFASSAGCRGPNTAGVATATLPQNITISRYVTPGTTLYDSGWIQGTQGSIENCNEWSKSWDAWTIWDGASRTLSSYGNSVYSTSDCCLSFKRVAANKQLEMSGDMFTLQIRQDSTEFTIHFIFSC